MVHDVHLFLLQIYTSSFELVGRNGIAFLSTVKHREAFHGLGVQDVAEFNSDCFSVFCLVRKKNQPECFYFPQGQPLAGCVMAVRCN
jgi:hypothetical protein